jgi:micrococcal nuclease
VLACAMRGPTLALVCALGACAAQAVPTPPSERPATFVRVIDGDTLEIRGEMVRISNIDAPERPPRSKCWAEAALSVQATQRVQDFIDVSQRLTLLREGKDRYGRTLARVQLGNDDLGEAMIFNGLAARWNGRRWDWCGAADLGDTFGPALAR